MLSAHFILHACLSLAPPLLAPPLLAPPPAAAPPQSQGERKPAPDPDGQDAGEREAGADWRDFGTRDPLLEKRARKNIEIAEFYARQKNFRASINRLTEIYEVYPQFTRFDRLLFLLGKYHLGQRRLLEDEAKRLAKQNQSEAAQRKSEEATANDAEARRYFSELIERFPESDLIREARKELDRLPALPVANQKRSPS